MIKTSFGGKFFKIYCKFKLLFDYLIYAS